MKTKQIIKIINPSGVLDRSNGDQFVENICEVLQEKVDIIVIDFKHINFMDSLGLSFLVRSLKKVRLFGVKFVICSLNSQIRMLLKLTNMEQVFSIFDDQEEFHKALLKNQK